MISQALWLQIGASHGYREPESQLQGQQIDFKFNTYKPLVKKMLFWQKINLIRGTSEVLEYGKIVSLVKILTDAYLLKQLSVNNH